MVNLWLIPTTILGHVTINDFIVRIMHSAFPGAHDADYLTWMEVPPPLFTVRATPHFLAAHIGHHIGYADFFLLNEAFDHMKYV